MPRTTLLIASLLAPVFAMAQDGDGQPPFEVVDGRDAALADYLWLARPLVVFADAPADPRFAEQMALLADQVQALIDRDVVVIADTEPGTLSGLRRELRPRGFMIALLAKDGSVVLRKPFPWDVREISRAIDKLPLRKQELTQDRAVTD